MFYSFNFKAVPFLITLAVLIFELVKTERAIFGVCASACAIAWFVFLNLKKETPESSYLTLFETSGRRFEELENSVEDIKIALKMKTGRSFS